MLIMSIICKGYQKEINIKYFDTDKYRNSKYYDEILEKYQIDQVPYMVLVKKDGSFETFDKKNIDKGELFKDWLIKNKENKEK